MTRSTLEIAMTLLCVAQGVSACSLAPMELREVSPDLMVVVTHRGKPVAGIEVRVVPEKAAGPAFSGVTDVDGRVLIKGLMAGRYHLTASHEDFDAGREWIEVVAVPGAKTKTRFDFEWVDSSYETRKIAGTLTGACSRRHGQTTGGHLAPSGNCAFWR
jgi:hypothetical protein